MTIKKGDKVKFLNDIGGGVVTRILGKTVYVEDDDGFEIPALYNDIVLLEQEADNIIVDRPIENKELEEYEYEEEGDDNDMNCYLGFLKGKSQNDLTGDFRVYLINDSNYFTFYTVSILNVKNVTPLYNGTLEPNTKEQLDIVPIQFLDGKTLLMQMVLFKKEKEYNHLKPIERHISFKSNQLLRAGSMLDNDYFEEKAKLYSIFNKDIEDKIEELVLMTKQNDHVKSKEVTLGKKRISNNKNEIMEVDLHIHELIDDTRGLSNHEMLQIQKNKFIEVIEENKRKRGCKIAFIHGVGNGVLKREIYQLLRTKYKNLDYQDASFKEYGYGATMVVI